VKVNGKQATVSRSRWGVCVVWEDERMHCYTARASGAEADALTAKLDALGDVDTEKLRKLGLEAL